MINDEREQERAELEALVRSAGWRRFRAMCQDEYSSGAQIALIEKVVKGQSDPGAQAVTAREVIACARAVAGVLSLPEAKLKKLTEVAPEAPLVPRRA